MVDRNEKKEFTRGLYKGARISVKTLDTAIVIGIILIVVLLVYGISNNGYTITFNSRGGSDVSAQKAEYAQTITLPKPPERQGYLFTGWYTDEACQIPLDPETTLEQDLTLYAGWKPAEMETDS